MPLIGSVALPLVLLLAISTWRSVRDAESRIAQERVDLARAAALTASSFVDDNLSTVRSLALIPELAGPAEQPEVDKVLVRVLRANPDWEGTGLIGPDGWNIAGAAAAPHTLYIGDRPYIQSAMASGQPIVSPGVVSRRTGHPTVILAVPIDFERGGRGVLIAPLSTGRLAADLLALPGTASTSVEVVDADGKTLVAPDPEAMLNLAPAGERPEVQAALAGQSGSLLANTGRSDTRLVAYAPVAGVGWGVLISQPTPDAFDLARRQLIEQAGLLLLAIVGTGLLAWRLGGRLNRLYARELVARAEAEEAARALAAMRDESEGRRRFLEGLIDAAPVAIAVLKGAEHRFVTINAACQSIKPNVSMLGMTVAQVFPELDARDLLTPLDHVWMTGERRAGLDQPVVIDREAGPATLYFTYVMSRYDDAELRPEGVLIVATDSTPAVIARLRAEREKDEFLATASHELKTPISSLGLYAQMIERMLAQGDIDRSKLERLATSLYAQVERTSQLIGDLLDVSRLESPGTPVRREPVDLVELARVAAQRARETLPEEDSHSIAVEPPETGSVVVEGDEARLDQVLTNLLSNAVKYSPGGGAIEVCLAHKDGHALLTVVDHGMGIGAAEREQIFSPFNRTADARRTGVEGTGLGLYISRRIVESQGGRIEVGDTPGGGATFTVRLPLASS